MSSGHARCVPHRYIYIYLVCSEQWIIMLLYNVASGVCHCRCIYYHKHIMIFNGVMHHCCALAVWWCNFAVHELDDDDDDDTATDNRVSKISTHITCGWIRWICECSLSAYIAIWWHIFTRCLLWGLNCCEKVWGRVEPMAMRLLSGLLDGVVNRFISILPSLPLMVA